MQIERLYSQKGEEVRINVRDAGLVHPDTGVQMELDVFVPSRNLAFEYQVCVFLPFM